MQTHDRDQWQCDLLGEILDIEFVKGLSGMVVVEDGVLPLFRLGDSIVLQITNGNGVHSLRRGLSRCTMGQNQVI